MFIGADDQSRVCDFATQCLHNAIFLCNQSLPQTMPHSSSSQPSGEALQPPSDHAAESTNSPLSPSTGLPYPNNGHRGRLGSTKEGSAAEAAEQLAMLSLDRSRASSGELCLQCMQNPTEMHRFLVVFAFCTIPHVNLSANLKA